MTHAKKQSRCTSVRSMSSRASTAALEYGETKTRTGEVHVPGCPSLQWFSEIGIQNGAPHSTAEGEIFNLQIIMIK